MANIQVKDATGTTKYVKATGVGSDGDPFVIQRSLDIAKAEDAVHGDGDQGVMLLAVRKDTAAALAGTDGDYIPLIVDSTGRLHVATRYTGQDDAAGPGYAAAIGGVYQSTVDEVDTNDVGIARVSKRRSLLEACDAKTITLTSAAPVPTDSDITAAGGAALTAADFDIRDTNSHYFIIPLTAAGFRTLAIGITTAGNAFDQACQCAIMGPHDANTGYSYLAEFTIPASALSLSLTSGASAGQGGRVGGATASTGVVYCIPAIASGAWPYIQLRILFTVAPTTGTITTLRINRAS